jgi:hypothetical protein
MFHKPAHKKEDNIIIAVKKIKNGNKKKNFSYRRRGSWIP